ncbi:MAG: glycosyltransferase family 4 protein [Lachnospiraceae bacterium]|nr:glycosyltransferase family 4 protein [Lachnospiraceae bacterium]
MRIAMLTNNYKPFIGGVPISIEHLAKALRALGNEVYVFAPSYPNQVEEEGVIRYPSFPVKVGGAPIPNILAGHIVQRIKELEIDVVHVHHPALAGNVALMVQKKLGIPVVYTYHTRYEQYLHYVKPLEVLNEQTNVVTAYTKYFCNRCNLLLAPTPGMKDYLESLYVKTPIEVLPTGISDTHFHPNVNRVKELVERYGANKDFLFCTVARLAKEKNLDFQLRELKLLKDRLSKKGKSFCHLILGEGPERAHLSKLIGELGLEDEVKLVGNVPNEEIPDYMAASDMFLFTSQSETQGIVILEAMAVGTPVVALDATGVRDVVVNGRNGFLTGNNEGEWGRQIEMLLEDGNLRKQMSEKAMETAGKYHESLIAQSALCYYEMALHRSREEACAYQY